MSPTRHFLHRTTPRSRRLVMVALAFALTMSACSIGVEESPREWSNWDRFDEPPEGSQDGIERIYLIDGRTDADGAGAMTTVQRSLPDSTSPYRALLDVLFDGPTLDEVARGLRSGIPSGTAVIGVPGIEQQGTIVVDLSGQLTSALGNDLSDALAQIVWTLCERPEVRQVRILVDGRALSWSRADGTTLNRPLTPFDFPESAIASQPDFPGIIEPPTSS